MISAPASPPSWPTRPSLPLLFSSSNPSSSPSALPNQSQPSGPAPPPEPAALGLTCVTMALGASSNLAALAILWRPRGRIRRSASSPFLVLTGALLLADLGGHLIPGALALLARGRALGGAEGRGLCQIFGACMVFFGLCPLLLGGAMALERCLGIARPLLHAAVATPGLARRTAALLASLALLLAALPLLAVGSYAPQFPGTWCFLPVHGPPTPADAGLALAFSSLGLAALALSLLCNALSGLALLQGRLAFPSPARALDLEMMGQLGGITLVSCVCWTPFLVFTSVSVGQFYSGSGQSGVGPGPGPYEQEVLLGLRLASWNQVLDPWVYILLRRAVLRRVLSLLHTPRSSIAHSSSCANSARPDACLRRHTQSKR